MTLSPINVRGEGETPTLVVRQGTSRIAFRLELAGNAPPAAPRAVVRTVTATEVWRGAATSSSPRSVTIEVPAAAVATDDYVITLYDVSPDGAETERHRYFVRIRTR